MCIDSGGDYIFINPLPGRTSRFNIRQLTRDEIDLVSGSGYAGSISTGLAGGWVGAVAGVGVGFVVGRPVGGVGFAIGGLVTFGSALSQR